MAKVHFNINPGYRKPTATVTKLNLKKGAVFEYAMGRAFPCTMTVVFDEIQRLPPVVLDYHVQDTNTTRQLVVELRGKRGNERARAGGKEVHIEADPPRSGWVRFDHGSSVPDLAPIHPLQGDID